MTDGWPQTPIEVRPATAPNGERGVLLQHEQGWVLISPDGADKLAQQLTDTAQEVRDE